MPGLLSKCRRIRSEARKIFYEANTFRIVISDKSVGSMLTPIYWFSSLPVVDRKSVKNVVIHFKYIGFEGSMHSWSNTLDALVASGSDPMTAFAHLPEHLYHKRREVVRSLLRQLKAIEDVDHSIIDFEIEEFDGDMFPHIWKQC